jgi:glycosyltransferase involved in cell wall biosynthesis
MNPASGLRNRHPLLDKTADPGPDTQATGPGSGRDLADAVAAFQRARAQTRRDILDLQDRLAATEARLDRLKPLFWAFAAIDLAIKAVVRLVLIPVGAVRALFRVGRLRTLVQDAQLRSQRLVRTGDGQWKPEPDHAAMWQYILRKLGLKTPTLYTVRQKQRLALASRPRVLHVMPNIWVGGSTQLVVDLFDHLGHAFEMEVATSSLPANGRHTGMPTHIISKPADPRAVRDLLRRVKPHIVHVHYWGDIDEPWYRPFFHAAEAFGCPIMQNVNTPVTPFGEVPVARNVFVSQSVLDRFGSSAPAQVIHPGIDLVQFAPRPFQPDAGGAVGMVYRFERDKLNEASIEPFIQLVRQRPQTRVILIGDGSLFAPFHARVAEEGLTGRFEFMGSVPYEALPDQYARFRVFVAPVWQESFGQVVPFAMAMGLAVAGHKVGALPEILGDDATLGTTADETAAIIARLLDDPAHLEAIGARTRSIARTAFGVDQMAIQYARLYREIAPAQSELMPGYPAAVNFPL